jgi:hypothetical protein
MKEGEHLAGKPSRKDRESETAPSTRLFASSEAAGLGFFVVKLDKLPGTARRKEDNVSMNINVQSGLKKEIVGTMPLRLGLRTNHGKVLRITPKGTVVTGSGRFNAADVTVRLTEARRAGYPDAEGCRRHKTVQIKQGAHTITV